MGGSSTEKKVDVKKQEIKRPEAKKPSEVKKVEEKKVEETKVEEKKPEEIKTINVIIQEHTFKIAEKVTDSALDAIDAIGIETEEVKPVVLDITSSVSTVVSSGLTELTKKIGLTMISESSLTDEQKILARHTYDSVKESVTTLMADVNINTTIKVTKTIGQLIRELENTQLDGKQISGQDKKAVAIQVGRILIKELTPDDKGEAEILMVYDLIAEQTLEAMIEVSKVVNVAIQEVATKCCPGLLSFFRR